MEIFHTQKKKKKKIFRVVEQDGILSYATFLTFLFIYLFYFASVSISSYFNFGRELRMRKRWFGGIQRGPQDKLEGMKSRRFCSRDYKQKLTSMLKKKYLSPLLFIFILFIFIFFIIIFLFYYQLLYLCFIYFLYIF